MTNEDLNLELYLKMSAEQERFRSWLMTLPPKEILEHSYEYTVREDILLAMEEHDLPDRQCRALLKSSSPLADVFHHYETWETGYMDDLREAVDSRANLAVREDFLKRQGDR